MARGFESKAVTDQQESVEAPAQAPREVGDPAVATRRRRLELARADVLRQLEAARAEAHRQTLKLALEALEKELLALG
jgi:hypothetical protein